jgi:hypothetical protein
VGFPTSFVLEKVSYPLTWFWVHARYFSIFSSLIQFGFGNGLPLFVGDDIFHMKMIQQNFLMRVMLTRDFLN